jgi:hypothetical protein
MRKEAFSHQCEYKKLAATLAAERAQVSEGNARFEAEKLALQDRVKKAEEASRKATKKAELAEQACRDSKEHEKKMRDLAEKNQQHEQAYQNSVFKLESGLAVANFVKDGFFKLLEMVFNYTRENDNNKPQPVEGESRKPARDQEDQDDQEEQDDQRDQDDQEDQDDQGNQDDHEDQDDQGNQDDHEDQDDQGNQDDQEDQDEEEM